VKELGRISGHPKKSNYETPFVGSMGIGHLGIGELGGMGGLLKRVKNKSLMTCPDAHQLSIRHDI
jgi:hypothetical protein